MAAVATREVMWLTGIAIAISSMDDLLADGLWLVSLIARHPRPPDPECPGHYAIAIPAWDESPIIGAMLQRLVSTLDHGDFRIFVGTYPNDPATAEAVRSLGDARISIVTLDHPGPTTKADCLNGIWRAMLSHERETARRFTAFVLHDAEDVVHPAELKLFDRHLPGCSMVQLPVLPIADRRSRWISGHYLDEFAQNHTRDMPMRSRFGAPVPSAGVATAIDRDALREIADDPLAPFDPGSLTEDYEIGHKLHRNGHRARFVRERINGELVATREYFPAELGPALGQKSRWLTGIALAGWDRLGWSRDLFSRWMLIRDRKGLFTAMLAFFGYMLMAAIFAQYALRDWLHGQHGLHFPPLLGDSGNALHLLLWANGLLLGWRLFMTACFTAHNHGFREGLRAIPRSIAGNIINALAARRAVLAYVRHLESGISLKWAKTAHRFPDAGQEATDG